MPESFTHSVNLADAHCSVVTPMAMRWNLLKRHRKYNVSLVNRQNYDRFVGWEKELQRRAQRDGVVVEYGDSFLLI